MPHIPQIGLDLLNPRQLGSSVHVSSAYTYAVSQTNCTASVLTNSEFHVTAALINLRYHQTSLLAHVIFKAPRALV